MELGQCYTIYTLSTLTQVWGAAIPEPAWVSLDSGMAPPGMDSAMAGTESMLDMSAKSSAARESPVTYLLPVLPPSLVASPSPALLGPEIPPVLLVPPLYADAALPPADVDTLPWLDTTKNYK